METCISRELSNEEYHNYPDTFSSSNLKTALEDIELFHKMYITKEIKREHIQAFDTGTYFHTLVLEPELLEKECAVYQGVRKGAKWEKFSQENAGKAIVTGTQQKVAENLAKLVEESLVANSLVAGCEPEVSAFAILNVSPSQHQIYDDEFTRKLTINGWEDVDFDEEVPIDTLKLTVKVRADGLIEGTGSILDLKSTSGNCKDEYSVKKKISNYQYDLSAAMYLDIFSLAMNKKFDNFYWIFASKDKHNCKTYLASDKNIQVGRAKWSAGVIKIAEAIADDWHFVDTISLLEPEAYQVMDWLKEK